MRLQTALVLVACCGLIIAQQPVAAGQSTVQKAYAEYKAANDKFQELMKDVRPKMQKDTPADERKALQEKVTAARKPMTEALETFQKAFAASDWQKADAKADADLVREGLMGLINGDHTTPDQVITAGQMFLKNFADHPMAKMLKLNALPNAYLEAGKIDEARAMLLAVANEPPPTPKDAPAGETRAMPANSEKGRALMALGDLEAAVGHPEQAMARYEEVSKLDDKNLKKYVELRVGLTGKMAPDIDSKTWIGGEAMPLSAMKGKVVLVDFWATWCGPCRHVMPKLDEMFQARQKDGLQVLGVTHFYKNGYLPANKEEMGGGGKSVNDLDEKTFPGHVEAFKKNSGISYPFVIGKPSDFENYKVSGIPTLAVVDREGKIVLVCVGSGSEALLKTAVTRLLGVAK